MVISIYTRHSADCKHTDIHFRQCRCPKWLHYYVNSKQHRVTAKTRSWEKAQQKARELELQFERAAAGEKPKKNEPVTVATAVDAFLKDKRSQQLEDSTIYKLEQTFEKQLLTWCKDNAVFFLVDLDLNALRKWRNSWELGPLAMSKRQERVRGFFNFCLSSGWIHENPAKGMSKIKVDQRPTDYFTADEYDKIIDSTYVYDSKTVEKQEMQNNATRLRTLAQLMRYSGLRIRDAVTLERNRLNDDNSLFLYSSKTGTPVYVPLPDHVADALRIIPPGPKPNPRYFFWSGNGQPKSVVADWQRAFRKLFKIAGLKKRCFPHMFRDTFSVELLLAGVPLEQVSMLLGHKSVKITEKHYAPFVRARQEQLMNSVRATFQAPKKQPSKVRVMKARA
jgi:integrase